MSHDHHIIPPTYLPILGSFAIFFMLTGVLMWLHGALYATTMIMVGFSMLMTMIFFWFGQVIRENMTTFRDDEVMDRSFRWGMVWFLFTEVALFGVFFGVLYYTRFISLSILGGTHGDEATHYLLWPHFSGSWPVFHTPDPSKFLGPHQVVGAWGLPAINTLILLVSGVTITLAHWALIEEKHKLAGLWQFLTILLGISFLCLQATEYLEAYTEHHLRFDSGIYGNIFYILTGLHGFHVTLGTIMLCVILVRILLEHFDEHHHFAFEAVAWYWHMVDIVWLMLFVFVYWL
ncbi:MAG: cytochrome c oxidase subunit 3 [Legionellales bacterium]|nr:cytochrome c oxidase subunit 3 [Legionellales bacterium]OUX66483.1 MAG: cytochrome c oxidase subunit 3 [Gammaproteobacteria bacterium TMED281]|tara:strand:- start:335 stop:1204 length:870 start_codon:yes stop_codon:yes gene_type:complete